MLDTFAMQQGGTQYRRLTGAFQRIFGATIFFGTDSQHERATVVHRARFNFMSEARIWYSRDPDQKLLPGDCQNVIVLSDEFYEMVLVPHVRKLKWRMWADHGVEFFIHPTMKAAPAIGFPEFFRQDRDGRPRGVIQVVRANAL